MAQRQRRMQERIHELPPGLGEGVGPAMKQDSAEADPAADSQESGPVIVVYRSDEPDSRTRLQIVQSGFGGARAWNAIVGAWRGAASSFALLGERVMVPLGESALACLRSAVTARVPTPARRPVGVRV